jgi:hypothetical protein
VVGDDGNVKLSGEPERKGTIDSRHLEPFFFDSFYQDAHQDTAVPLIYLLDPGETSTVDIVLDAGEILWQNVRDREI